MILYKLKLSSSNLSSFKLLTRNLSVTNKYLASKASNDKPLQKGLLLGVYNGCEKTDITLSPIAQRYGSDINYDFKSALSQLGLGEGEVSVFNNLGDEYRMVAVVGMGPQPAEDQDKDKENIYMQREYIRNAAGAGVRALQERGIDEIYVEHMLDGEAAAEGATLGVWLEQQFRNYEDQLTESKVFLYEKGDDGGKHKEMWNIGFEKGKAQNLARYLTSLPANVMTPTIFGQHCAEELCPCGVSVDVHDHNWIKSKGMEAFLTIAQGSCEPPVLVELKYSGGGSGAPVVMVGKGCTFDSGGICLSDCESMMYQHADMAGAGVIAGVFKALCKLKTKVNVTALLPMYENMPSENAVKTGSVVKALNERTIRILHTVHDGRVVLSDVLSYAGCLQPGLVINVATLSKSMMTAMGSGASGAFSTNKKQYELMHRSGEETGERIWSFPFYDDIMLTNAKAADFGNTNTAKSGSTLFGASFLKEFVPPPPTDFIHIDVSGSTFRSSLFPSLYLRKSYATGRPVRALVEFFNKFGSGEHEE